MSTTPRSSPFGGMLSKLRDVGRLRFSVSRSQADARRNKKGRILDRRIRQRRSPVKILPGIGSW